MKVWILPEKTPNIAAGALDFMRSLVNIWAILFFIWLCIGSTLDFDIVLTGALVTGSLAALFASRGSFWGQIHWSPRSLYHFLAYSFVFFIELVRANMNVMRYVYSPHIVINPGIVKIRTGLKSPLGRLALANSIALTPGSLVMDMKGEDLFIHWLDVETVDIEEASLRLAGPFEKHLEVVFG